MNSVLTEMVKRKLNITWNDDDTNARIKDIIGSAIPEMKHLLGIAESDFDFCEASTERTLLLSYCFYKWNHSEHEFQGNYANIIAQVRAQHEVKQYLKGVGEIE